MMKVGVLVGLEGIEEKLRELKRYGIEAAQICNWNGALFTDENAEKVKRAMAETGINIITLWCGWPGPAHWNFTEGPLTLGLVPTAYRFERTKALLAGVEFAHKCGLVNVATHAGFIPEDCNSELYRGTLVALSQIVGACKRYDMNFLFETGQETPVTLLRTIEDLGGKNVGINFDTGNIVLYGKGNPNDAFTVFGKYVKDFHCKDGLYPTDGRNLGREVPLGQGVADWRRLIRQLYEIGYDGPLTIEREISGDQQTVDILNAKKMLEQLLEEENPCKK